MRAEKRERRRETRTRTRTRTGARGGGGSEEEAQEEESENDEEEGVNQIMVAPTQQKKVRNGRAKMERRRPMGPIMSQHRMVRTSFHRI